MPGPVQQLINRWLLVHPQSNRLRVEQSRYSVPLVVAQGELGRHIRFQVERTSIAQVAGQHHFAHVQLQGQCRIAIGLGDREQDSIQLRGAELNLKLQILVNVESFPCEKCKTGLTKLSTYRVARNYFVYNFITYCKWHKRRQGNRIPSPLEENTGPRSDAFQVWLDPESHC